MNPKQNIYKMNVDTLRLLCIISSLVLAFFLIVFIAKTMIAINNAEEAKYFYQLIFKFLSIVVFASGLIISFRMKKMIYYGITRKHFVISNLLAIIIFAVFFTLIIFGVSHVATFLFTKMTDVQFNVVVPSLLNELANEAEISPDVYRSAFSIFYIDPQTSLLLAFISISLNVFMFTLFGFLTGFILYRYMHLEDPFVAIFYLAIVLFIANIWNAFMCVSLQLPITNERTFLRYLAKSLDNLSAILPIICLILLLGATIYLIHLLTRKIPIKV